MRIGVVGVGGMGQAHCDAVRKLDIAKLVAVADIREEVVKQVAEKYGVRAFRDYRQMMDEVDAVVVATPPWQHAEVVAASAQAGKHAFCEKPLAASLEDCDTMIAACDEAGVTFMVGQVLRFYPVHELGKKMVDEGEIGEVVYLETDYTGQFRLPRERPKTWFGKMGGLLENGIHKADLINWFGGQAETVAAEVGSLSGHEDWEDYSLTLIRFKQGAIGVLRWGPFLGARGTTDTIIDGSKGSLRLDMGAGIVYRKLIGESDWTSIKPEVPDGWAGPVVAELRHFVECAREGRKPLVDGYEGRRAVELALASYKSAKERLKVVLPMN